MVYSKIKSIIFIILTFTFLGCGQQAEEIVYSAGSKKPKPPQELTAGLKLHPDNPRYFQDVKTGEPVLIAAYFNIVPTTISMDYNSDINTILSHQGRYARIWHLLPWEGQNAFWPWARSSMPGAPMGGNKIDFDTWDTAAYWPRMKDALAKATDAKIVSELMIFDRCGISPNDRWKKNPWASNNNINSLETPTSDGDGTPEFYLYGSRPRMRMQQERYIMKLIDETVKYNVIYEIENEHWESNDPDFADHYGQFVKNYIRNKYPSITRLVSYNSLTNDLEVFYSRPSIDIINKHFGGEADNNPSIINDYVSSRWGMGKPINIDEFANGTTDPKVLRIMSWGIITGGGHFHIEDANPASNPWGAVDNIRQFLAESQWNFIQGVPNNSVAPSGTCMVNTGKEYVCYFPAGGSKSVQLPAGNYRKGWWDPRSGGFTGVQNFQHTSGSHGLSTPNSKDWVLHIFKN